MLSDRPLVNCPLAAQQNSGYTVNYHVKADPNNREIPQKFWLQNANFYLYKLNQVIHTSKIQLL